MVKVALLIGVSEYEPGLNPLPAAVKDVEALRRILQDPELGDFHEVKVLTNPDPQTMQYEVETLFTGRTREDLVLLFFSGHGIKDDGNALYFATRITRKNSKGDLIRSTAVPARFIHEVMNNSRAKRQAIVLDCCFSGAFDPALQAKDDGSVDLRSQLGAEGRVVLASSSSTQYSFEQHGSDLSLYTRYLVEGIETGAGDRNEDGKVSVRELHEYATSRVHDTAPNMTPKLITLKDMGFDMVLAKAKITDPKLRYRRQVERYASRGHISAIGRTILDEFQTQLELSPEVALGIEADVLRPYQERLENLQRYRTVFSGAIKQEYPLSSHAQSELEDLREVLGLRQEDIALVEQEILAQIPHNPEPSTVEQPLTPDAELPQKAAIVQPTSPESVQKQVSGPPASNRQRQPATKSRSVKTVLIAAFSGLTLLIGGILALNTLQPSNDLSSDDYSEGDVDYSEAEAGFDDSEFDGDLDRILRFPDQPIPAELNYWELELLSTEQANELDSLFNSFNQVDYSSEPVEHGRATIFSEWNALCFGEVKDSTCPRSAEHEILSDGDFKNNVDLWTSRGWLFYR